MITIRFECGHELQATGEEEKPRCPTCGEGRISDVRTRAPRFRGYALGPLAQYQELEAQKVKLGK